METAMPARLSLRRRTDGRDAASRDAARLLVRRSAQA